MTSSPTVEFVTMPDGVRLAVEIRRSPDDGPVPVVLHHGFAADGASNWTSGGVVDHLRADHRTVVLIDARGHGRSDKPYDPAFYGHSLMARDVDVVLRSLQSAGLGSSFDLIGYSMGGYVAAHCAVADASRADDAGTGLLKLRSVVISGIGGSALGGTRFVDGAPLSRIAIAEALEVDDVRTVADRAARQFRRFADATGADRRALAACMRSPFEVLSNLSSIRIPAMVLVGDDDNLATNPERLANEIPGASLVVVPGDHLRTPSTPAFASALMTFLQRVDAGN